MAERPGEIPDVASQLAAPLERGLDTQPLSRAAGLAAETGWHTARYFGQVGNAANQIQTQIQQAQTISANSSINDDLDQKQLKWQKQWASDFAANPKLDPEEYIHDKILPDLQSSNDLADTPASRAHAAELIHSTARGLAHGMWTDHQHYQVATAQNSAVDARNSMINAVEADPGSLDNELAKYQTKVKGLFVPAGADPADIDKDYSEARRGAITSILDTQASKVELGQMTPDQIAAISGAVHDPKGTIAQFADPEAMRGFDKRVQAALATHLDIQNYIDATHVKDWGTAVRQGDPTAYGNLTTLAARFQASPKKEDQVKAQDILNERDDDDGYYKGSQAINQLSAVDAKALVDSLPTPDARNHVQKGIAEAYASREQGMKSDPVTWLTTNNATVGGAAQRFAAQPTPQNYDAYATALVASQAKYNPAMVPKVLPTALTQEVSATMQSVDQTSEGAAKAGAELQRVMGLTGRYSNYALHELQAAHIITGAQFAAAQIMGRPEGMALGQEILRAKAVPEKTLVETSGVPTAKAEGAMRTALSGLAATFADTANGHELIASYIDAGAAVLQARGAGHLGDAQALANSMVLDRFNVRNNLRIPKTFDDHDVANGADIVQAGIDKHDIQPPPSFSGFGPALQKDAYVQDLKDYGYWATNDRGDGAILRYQGLPVYEKVNGGRVVPVEIPYKDLQNVGRSNRSVYENVRRFATQPDTLNPMTGGTRLLPGHAELQNE